MVTAKKPISDTQNPPCPTNQTGYHLISNSCFFFEEKKLTWENAKTGCKDKFDGGGKLFEPKSLVENKMVYDVVNPIHNLHNNEGAWVGVDDFKHESSFRYSSTGLAISFKIPWFGRPFNGGRGPRYNCILLHNNPGTSNHGKWLDYDCSNKEVSICQPDM